MSGAEQPVGASSGSLKAVPPPQQQQPVAIEIIGQQAQSSSSDHAIRELIAQQQLLLQEMTRSSSRSDDLRGWLLMLVSLTASITYSAALNPPGGFWQDDKGHVAGTPVLRDKFSSQYHWFYYCNATSFLTSLLIITLISNPVYNRIEASILRHLVILDILALFGAFQIGSGTTPRLVIPPLILGCIMSYIFGVRKNCVNKLVGRLCNPHE